MAASLKPKPIIRLDGHYARVVSGDTSRLEARYFGQRLDSGELILDLFEAYYLLEKGSVELQGLSKQEFLARCMGLIPEFIVKYKVFRFFRDRGYVVKTGSKYGFDFRIYEGDPEKTHSIYLVKIIFEDDKISAKDIVSWVRIAKAAKKDVILVIATREADVLFYQITWKGQL
jgi:tRNA-intron endonuclease